MKKFIALALLAVMMLTCLVACNKDEDVSVGDGSSTSTTSGSTDAEKDWKDAETGKYVPKHEVRKAEYVNKTFTVAVRGGDGTYSSDDFTTNSTMYGELIDNAVKTRNEKVEELYGVKLEVVKEQNINELILNDCSSGTGLYDLIMPTLPSLSSLARQDYLIDLSTLENFYKDAPWYSQNCTEAFSFNNKIYFTTGDLTILPKVCTPSILFNKEMASKNDLGDLYSLVDNKEWTFDKMIEMAQKVAVIGDPSTPDADNNIYGMVTGYADSISFFGSSGEKICDKDAQDMPMLSIGSTERSINIAQKILETLSGGHGQWLVYAQECPTPIWETSFAIFYEGRALFRPSAFSATTKLRTRSQIEFGILPMPLMDFTQEQYRSYCTTGETVGFAIPTSAKDPEFSAYMLEAYSAWAKNYITPAYYEVNLRYKDTRDDESQRMLDIIFDNIVYDMGECYDFGGMKNMFMTLTQNGSSDIVSSLEAVKSQAQEAIDQMKQDLS